MHYKNKKVSEKKESFLENQFSNFFKSVLSL